MPDTRESGDGKSPPPVPVLAWQPFGLLSGVGFRFGAAALSVAIALSVVACEAPQPESTPPETFPTLTDEEMERFCTKYQEVKDLSYSEIASALVDYAPDNSILKSELINASEHPLRGIQFGQTRIGEYISRCPPMADPP